MMQAINMPLRGGNWSYFSRDEDICQGGDVWLDKKRHRLHAGILPGRNIILQPLRLLGLDSLHYS